MFHGEDKDDDVKKRLLQKQEENEERERFALDEELRIARQKRAEDDAWQVKQAAQIQNAGALYKLFYRIGSTVTGAIKVAGATIGEAAKILPPLNALITGMLFIIDLVEAVFISKETRNRRAIKIANSVIGTGLSIAAVVLSFNPATSPLGIALSAGAMAIASAKDAVFWYKASRDLRKAKKALAIEKNKLNGEISDFVRTQHHDDIIKFRDLNHAITEMNNKSVLSTDERSQLALLKQNKNALTFKINHSVNSREDVVLARQNIRALSITVKESRVDRNQKRKSFLSNFVSFLGTALLAVSAFVVTAAVISNPIGLGIAGVALLGIATAVAIKNRFFPSKEKAASVAPILNHEENHEHIEHVADTEHIVHQLAHGSREVERQTLASNLASSYDGLWQKPAPEPKLKPSVVQENKVIATAKDNDIDPDETPRFKHGEH
jgi:membrane protein implicated in regulation of membrane protease activity